MKKCLPLALLCLLALSSCTSVEKISRHLNEKQHSLSYLHDSQPQLAKAEEVVRINSVTLDKGLMPVTAQVTRLNGFVVPLLVFNYWRSEKLCVQGMNMMNEKVDHFFKRALESEVKRSGSFHLDTLNTSKYTLDVKVEKMKTQGTYLSEGFTVYVLYGTISNSKEQAGPTLSQVSLTYSLKEDGKEILTNTLNSNVSAKEYVVGGGSRRQLIHNFGANMADMLSQNIKLLSEQMVAEVNSYFDEHRKVDVVTVPAE